MATTTFATGHALTVKKWSDVMFAYATFAPWFSKFIGPVTNKRGANIETSANALVQLKTDFQAGKGDTVTFGMVAPLTGAGVAGDGTLEGNEEAMTFYDWPISLIKTRNAVRSGGSLSDRRPAINLRAACREQVGLWMAKQVDDYTIAALSGIASSDGNIAANVPSSYRKWVGGQTAAGVLTRTANNLDSELAHASETSHQFGTLVIEAVKRMALEREPQIRPIVVDGREFYVMIIHPLQGKALRQCTEWKTIQSAAGVRGLTNPIFTGMLGEWDGVILHENSKIQSRLGAGGSTPTEYFDSGDDLPQYTTAARALFCGAQAAVQAFGQKPTYVEKEFDYGDKKGVAIGAILACGKPEFNSIDYGVIVVDTQTTVD